MPAARQPIISPRWLVLLPTGVIGGGTAAGRGGMIAGGRIDWAGDAGAGTRSIVWHFEQRTLWPAELSGAPRMLVHFGQRIEMGMSRLPEIANACPFFSPLSCTQGRGA
jgi:hypothetical protein